MTTKAKVPAQTFTVLNIFGKEIGISGTFSILLHKCKDVSELVSIVPVD